MHASGVPLLDSLTHRAVRTVASVLFLAACAGDSDPTTADAGLGRGGSGGTQGSGGSAGVLLDAAGLDAVGDAPSPIADGSNVDEPPCIDDTDAPMNCPEDLPPEDDCPATVPSYANVIAAIVAKKCTVCHQPGGRETANQFDTYAKIMKNSNNIHMLTQVYACRMPKSCGEPLTPSERQSLLKWLVCGAPNN
jgi:hypothetical protein